MAGRPPGGPPYEAGPGSGPPQAGYPAAPRKRRRRWYTRKRFLMLVVLVVVLAVINNGDGKTEQPLPPGTARDGILEFTVLDWRCGLDSVGTLPLVRQAQGQLCTVRLQVTNFGGQSRRVFVGSQKLRDDAGRVFDADGGAWGYLEAARPFVEQEINPGNELIGMLVYDIAEDAQPIQLLVHDSPFSGGAPIQLA